MRVPFLSIGWLSLLIGCVMSSESDKNRKLLGYSTGNFSIGPYKSFQLIKDTVGTDSFFIYSVPGKSDTIGHRTLAALESHQGHVKIFDAGGHCLTIFQSGKDTVKINGQTAIVDVPIEPCFPFQFEKP